MAINPLSLAESLRPWRAAGILGLLAEPGSDEAVLPEDQGVESGSAPEIAAEPLLESSGAETARLNAPLSSEYDSGTFPPSGAHSASSVAAPASPATHPSGPSAHRGAAARPGSRAKMTGQKTNKASQEAKKPADSLNWPEAWQVLLARTSPAPIVWTYAELGDDLTGNGDQERAACLRRLIASLQLPKGSSAFWPVCLAPFIGETPFSEEQEDAVSRPVAFGAASRGTDTVTPSGEARFFQAGLQRLSPKVIIMLGAPALSLSGLSISMPVPFTQQIHKGRLYVLLPDFTALLSKATLQERAYVFLRAALSGLSLS